MINYFRIIRIHHYVKNFFIFLPIFFAGQLTDLELLLKVCISFLAFSITTSAVYILNDFRDIEEDRLHPSKKHRPLAQGNISNKNALLLMCILFILGIFIMAKISLSAFYILSLYIVLNISYSFYIKHISILDVVLVAAGFVLRLFVGSEVTEIQLSKWIIIMTFLLALFMVLAKRRDDVLIFLKTGTKIRRVIGNYNLQFIDGMMILLSSSVIITYIFYTTSVKTIERMQSEYLYTTSLFVILGFMRYLQLTIVGNNSGAPTSIILKDKFMLLTIMAWTLTFAGLIYFRTL